MPAAEPPDDLLGPTDVAKAFVYGLVGVGAAIVTGAPKAVKQARSDLVAARFIGEMAVTQGASQLRERIGQTDAPSDTAPTPHTTTGSDAGPDRSEPDDHPVPDPVAENDAPSRVDPSESDVPSVDELAIPDYDTVPAIDVVMQLADLDAHERAQIGAYELVNRRRRTILGKLQQLEEAE